MTIAYSNWCPDCNEACHDHPEMCTVCGATLTSPPIATTTTTTTSPPRMRAVPDSVVQQLRASADEIQGELSSLQTRIDAIRNEHSDLDVFFGGTGWISEFLSSPTIDLSFFDQFEGSSSPPQSSATATAVLSDLPRIQHTTDSAQFQECLLELNEENNDVTKSDRETGLSTKQDATKKHFIPAIPGDFSNWSNVRNGRSNSNTNAPAHHRLGMSNLAFVVADPPGTGEGGAISEHTIRMIQNLRQKHRVRVILYMNRGGGLSFVQKAMLAQQAGASICVIGNHLPNGPWPYTMSDSTNEATSLGLTIPTVMISYAHGQLVQQIFSKQQRQKQQIHDQYIGGSINVQSKDHMECCICTETYSTGCTIIQIKPGCGHYFHEACALQWLAQHNTCPFCRHELPFEDDDMERHRLLQQQQRQQSGSNDVGPNDYYG